MTKPFSGDEASATVTFHIIVYPAHPKEELLSTDPECIVGLRPSSSYGVDRVGMEAGTDG